MIEKKECDSFIFTHIPKCGGTSFRKLINDAAIESGVDKNKIYIPGFNDLSNDKNINQLNEAETETFKRGQYKVIAAHSKYNLHKEIEIGSQNPFYYTILREPVKRFISHYHFFYYKLGYNNLNGVHLDDLPEEKLLFLVQKLANIQTDYLANFKFKKVIGEENLLKLAKYNLQYEYGGFGLLEYIDISINKMKEISPNWLKINNDLPSLNSSGSNEHNVSDNVIEIIRKNNALDINLYEFGKMLFENEKNQLAGVNSV